MIKYLYVIAPLGAYAAWLTLTIQLVFMGRSWWWAALATVLFIIMSIKAILLTDNKK